MMTTPRGSTRRQLDAVSWIHSKLEWIQKTGSFWLGFQMSSGEFERLSVKRRFAVPDACRV